MMRERFDRIEIIDLRGDLRRGERAGVENDQGVFNIRVGTAITLAIADGSKSSPDDLASVRYTDSWTEARFSRPAKLAWLREHADVGALHGAITVDRGLLEDLRPRAFRNGDLLDLRECFRFYRSGLQTKRDHFVYDVSRPRLADRIRRFLASDDDEARSVFHDTRDRLWTSARAVQFDERMVAPISYRPFDRRYLYNHASYGDFLRPELQAVWGRSNVCIYGLPSGTNAGPAVWAHGLFRTTTRLGGTTEGMHFRCSTGGRVRLRSMYRRA